jgi:hypothetical protein
MILPGYVALDCELSRRQDAGREEDGGQFLHTQYPRGHVAAGCWRGG